MQKISGAYPTEEMLYDSLKHIRRRITGTEGERIDMSGLLMHNQQYCNDYSSASEGKKIYFNNIHSHGGPINGSKLLRILGDSKKSLGASESLDSIIPSSFALSYALDCEKPDRVLAIMNGAIGLAATAEYFGAKVEKIEAHKKGALARDTRGDYFDIRKNDSYSEKLSRPIKEDEKVLIIEDTSYGGENTTYGLVIKNIISRYNVKPENISLYFGVPGHGFSDVFNIRNINHDSNVLNSSSLEFKKLLDSGAYFLTYRHVPISDRLYESLGEPNWRVIRELNERGDIDIALERFVKRLNGERLD